MKRQTKSQSVRQSAAPRKALGKAKVKPPAARTGKGKQSVESLDLELMLLLAKRVEAVRADMQYTKQQGQPLELWRYHQTAIEHASKQAEQLGLEVAPAVQWIKHVVSLCFELAHVSEPIAYLGPIYSYSYLAAAQHFGLAAPLVPVATIAAVFDELLRGQATYGVVPIENSTDGRVVDTLGMFARLPIKICGEVLQPVHHCLLGRGPRAEIAEIYSKPQAMSQCRGWLSKHVPDARLIEISSTAAAARLAAEKPGAAAVASREAGIHHGLQIIDENIEDNQNNVTRFAIIGNKVSEPTNHDKTSLMFQLRHQPGALAEAMVTFQKAKLNLTWIESFPLADHPREYLFFVELEGHIQSRNVSGALAELRKQTLRLEVLGSYPRAEGE